MKVLPKNRRILSLLRIGQSRHFKLTSGKLSCKLSLRLTGKAAIPQLCSHPTALNTAQFRGPRGPCNIGIDEIVIYKSNC